MVNAIVTTSTTTATSSTSTTSSNGKRLNGQPSSAPDKQKKNGLDVLMNNQKTRINNNQIIGQSGSQEHGFKKSKSASPFIEVNAGMNDDELIEATDQTLEIIASEPKKYNHLGNAIITQLKIMNARHKELVRDKQINDVSLADLSIHQNDTLQKLLAEKQDRIKTLEHEKGCLNDLLSKAKSNEEMMKSEINKLMENNNKVHGEKAKLEEEASELRVELISSTGGDENETIKTLRECLGKEKSKIEQLEAKNKELSESNSKIYDDNSNLKKEKTELEEKLERLLRENSSEKDEQERETYQANSRTNQLLTEMKKQLDKLTTTMSNRSYSDALRAEGNRNHSPRNGPGRSQNNRANNNGATSNENSANNRRPMYSVCVSSEQRGNLEENLLRSRINELNKPKEIFIKSIDKSRMYVNSNKEEYIDAIISKIETIPYHRVNKTEKPKPRIIIKNVDKNVLKENVIDNMRLNNEERAIKYDKLKVVYEIYKSDWQDKNVVLTVDEDYYDEFKNLKEIKIGNTIGKLHQYIKRVTQCYHCGGFNHRASINGEMVCTNERSCLNCAREDHSTYECNHRGFPSCINCKKSNMNESNHVAYSKNCPSYIKQLNRISNDQ